MAIDRKKLYIISSVTLAVLLLTLFAPMGRGRIIAAILLLPLAIISLLSIKKRVALSLNEKQVLLLFSVMGLLYFVFYYVSALYFGFTKTGYGFKTDIIFLYIIPIAIIFQIPKFFCAHVSALQDDKSRRKADPRHISKIPVAAHLLVKLESELVQKSINFLHFSFPSYFFAARRFRDY